ncbi:MULTISPECIES: DUF3887 domain-containing protein [Shewanella]|uniref:DUF3887 domain-containing protein n=1 Tax=Shewanella metallivivens TaxID=2872342 RepID=A0ABT5TQJ4_9GAMM|nr:DUF3887 domain-containing protein [Shewanella metallivivens]MDD8060784.1 DUF3887 domain-containing protein [Shewanella metallivivens]
MDFDKLTDEEILNIANPLMDNLMEGSSERNHQKHTRDFTDRLKAIVTEENLLKQWKENKIGEFSKREFLSIIHKSDSIFVVWKQWFTNSHEEFLAEICIVEQAGKLLVDHVWIR